MAIKTGNYFFFKSFLYYLCTSKSANMEERILSKAAELFLNNGVKSVTMDEIARELGMSKKTIYACFETKNELVEATSLYIFDGIANGIAEIKKGSNNPIEELFSIRNFILLSLREEKASPEFQLKKYYPEIFAKLRAKQKSLVEASLSENIRRGIAEGYYRSEIRENFIARMYFIGMTGIKDRVIFPKEMFAAEELTESFLEYHLRAIVTDKGLQILKPFINHNH